MSDKLFDQAVRDWLEDGSDRTPPTAIDAVLFAVKTTPQQRDLWVPWRFTQMPRYLRYAAAAAIVAIIGVGVLVFNSRPSGVGTPSPAPTPTAAATAPTTPTPSPAALQIAPGITAWTTYRSAVYGITFGYPDHWHVESSATRRWQPTDGTGAAEQLPFADVFASPGGVDQIGLWVWQMAPGSGADITSVEGLAAWVKANMCDEAIDACATVADVALPMCVGQVACGPAVLVPLSDGTSAFLGANVGPTDGLVTIVSLGRPDSFPGAAQYGGSVQLLKSILTTMDVFPPEPGQTPAGT